MQPGATSRNPAASLLASLFVPGVGTMINGETGKGTLILGAWLIGLLLVLAVIGILIVPAVWIYGLYDAYEGARRYNLAHQPGGPGVP